MINTKLAAAATAALAQLSWGRMGRGNASLTWGCPTYESPRFSVITFFTEMAFPVCSWNSRHFSGLNCLHGLVRSLLTA